jgi:serine/threonine-protein kinase
MSSPPTALLPELSAGQTATAVPRIRPSLPAALPVATPQVSEYSPAQENPLDIDWVTIALGLLALIAVGGLIPFYLWVYFLFF